MSEITKLVPGKRYRVTATIEGEASQSGNIYVGGVGSVHTAFGTTSVVINSEAAGLSVEEIEPEPIPGRIYVDSEGDRYLRQGLNPERPWLYLGWDGLTGRYAEDEPVRPLTLLGES